MNQLGTVYATKRRRRNSKSLKPPPKDGLTKSNPSKRHRERLNAELDTLASLLPFEATILSKLDKLSILRLSVSYLRTKSYFQVAMYGIRAHQGTGSGGLRGDAGRNHHDVGGSTTEAVLDCDLILQALNGFLLILASEGEVFFASHTIESYLGFHQSDIVHQSVYELVHSEDREELQRQLMWNSFLPADGSKMTLQEILQAENFQCLERSFTVRFRCLLDNTSGFLRLDIRGRIKVLHGQNRKTEEPPLALFAVCTPFGPPSLLEVPQKDVMFKSKQKLDMSLVSMDQRGKMLLGYTDNELANKGGYDLVHFDDLAYVANAHQELLKTGASGMIAYRVITKDGQWQWLQTSSRLVYKCSKPDFIICTHRPLMEEEGRDLLGKRTMDFKVSYLDATLNSSSYTADLLDAPATPAAPAAAATTTTTTTAKSPKTRRYKNQLRDILTTCRKRKMQSSGGGGGDYLEDAVTTAAAAYAGGGTGVYAYPTDNGLSSYVQPALQNLYPTLDNSRFLATEDFLQYRHLSNYYADYAHHPTTTTTQYAGNGYLEVPSRACLPPYDLASKDDKLYPCQMESAKYDVSSSSSSRLLKSQCCDFAGVLPPPPPSSSSVQVGLLPGHADKADDKAAGNMNDQVSSSPMRADDHSPPRHHQQHHHPSPTTMPHYQDVVVVPDLSKPTYSNDTRQTVLMWGSAGLNCRSNVATPSDSASSSSPTEASYPGLVVDHHHHHHHHHLALDDMHASCKWGNGVKSTPPHASSPHAVAARANYYAADVSTLSGELQQHRIGNDKQDGNNPLLSISEVTNALLSHD